MKNNSLKINTNKRSDENRQSKQEVQYRTESNKVIKSIDISEY